MPVRLSGLDAAYLHLETDRVHLHVGSVLVLDARAAPGGRVTREDVCAQLAERLPLAPALRRRLAEAPLGLDHPRWVPAELDLDAHVRAVRAAAPGGLAELAEVAAERMGSPLDRSRPLWQLTVVEGMAEGRVGLVATAHHSLMDGAAGTALTALLLAVEPALLPPPADEEPPIADSADPVGPLQAAGRRLVSASSHALRLGLRSLEAARGAADQVWEDPTDRPAAAGTGSPPERSPSLFSGPVAPWNRPIGPARRVALGALSLADVNRVRSALGGTVNDVVLACAAGGLRTYLLALGAPADKPLVAMVPVALRHDLPGDAGNRTSLLLVALPVGLDDARERYEAVRRAADIAKARHEQVGAETLGDLAEIVPDGLVSAAAQIYSRLRVAEFHRPLWNVVVSSLPGPQGALALAGAPLSAIYPLGPVHEGNGLSLNLITFDGQLFLGVNADRDLVRDAGAVVAAVEGALTELVTIIDEPEHR